MATATVRRASIDEPWKALMRIREEQWVPREDFGANYDQASRILTSVDPNVDSNDYRIAPADSEDDDFNSCLRTNEDPKSKSTCVICMAKPSTIAFLHGDSLHTCCCASCAKEYVRFCKQQGENKCPYCRQTFKAVYKNYIV